MSDDYSTMLAGWKAAVEECLLGHTECTYGGLTSTTGYWLVAEGCDRTHGDQCAWCAAESTTGFVGWADARHAEMFRVPACEEHASRWCEMDPGWRRNV